MSNLGKTEKICGFYVSDMHFLTMILPYINKKIKEENAFYTFFEFNQEKNINMLLQRVLGKEIEKEKIAKINWEYSPYIEYKNIEKKLYNINTKSIILISGSENYINRVNENLDILLKNKKYKDLEIKIINCYEANIFNKNIKEILDEHNKIINTSGEHEISDMFEGYNKKVV